MRQLVDVARYLQSMNVYHMDYKDENVVVADDYSIKLVDFGSAHILPAADQPMTRFFGTMEYAPPEVLRKQPYLPVEADVWAMGSLMFTMLNGQVPFASAVQTLSGQMSPLHDAAAVADAAGAGKKMHDSQRDMCQSLIINGMLHQDGDKRPGWDELDRSIECIILQQQQQQCQL
jgi:serine/threonine protein kinase